jgi:two-component system, LytTR family, response regulator
MANLPASTAAADGLVPLRWRRPWRWPWLLGLVLGAVLVFQVLTLQRGNGGELAALLRGQLGPYLRQLLGYYLLFELVSGAVLLGVCGWYFRRWMPRALRPTPGGLLRYELRFLPAALGSILVLGPLTNTLRYLALNYPDYRWVSYFPEWFFTPAMFANYLLPVLLLSYGLLNANLLLDFYQWRSAPPGTPAPAPARQAAAVPAGLTVFDAEGETLLPVRELRYVEVAAPKQYRAHGPGRHYAVRQTLAELEALLDPRVFFRLNRSVLVNLRYVRNYSYWENDKYIVRLTDGQTEFVMARSRLQELRRRLAGLAAAPDAPVAAAEP